MQFLPFLISRCSKLIAIKLYTILEMHGKVRRGSVAGYAAVETFACSPKERTRWWQRYREHLHGILYRLILNSYLSQMPISNRLSYKTADDWNEVWQITVLLSGKSCQPLLCKGRAAARQLPCQPFEALACLERCICGIYRLYLCFQ